MAKRREFELFSLSFLDCICCGFGAIILLFILSMGAAKTTVRKTRQELESTREQLRATMREVGFLRVQDSAWVFPYDCEEFIALLKADLHVGKDILYAVIEHIENDTTIRRHFGLPKNSAKHLSLIFCYSRF